MIGEQSPAQHQQSVDYSVSPPTRSVPAATMRVATSFWDSLDLAKRFAIMATAVVGLAMSVLGWWVGGRIERGVVEHAAATTALSLDSFVEPHLQDLARGKELSLFARDQLTAILKHSKPGRSVIGLTVWTTDGSLAFSAYNDASLAPGSESAPAITAWDGSVESKFVLTSSSLPLLKVFAPIHEPASGRIIAVVELDEDAQDLANDLKHVRYKTGGVAGLLSMAMIASLFGIVRQASQTINEQRQDLSERVETLSSLLVQNSDLQRKLVDANRRSADTNDRGLRKIGAELHDGPIQLIALALLRLEAVRQPFAGKSDCSETVEIDAIESALRDALTEMRGLSSGLSLPRLEGTGIAQAIEYAVMNYERRCRTKVKLDISKDLYFNASMPILTCAYRFTQEALNNGFRHAQAQGQSVTGIMDGEKVVIEVSDEGPGFTVDWSADSQKGLGLAGLRDRLESLGGTLDIRSGPGQGAKVIASIDLGLYRRKAFETAGT